MTHLGPAAPAGLILTETAALGAEYKHNLFCACFNLHKVTRHVLVPDGATFRTVDHDFVTCDDLDFHPTDVKEEADGSLLVVDTGGWYKLCCPTSVFHKPDVSGAIYRVRRTEKQPTTGPTDLDRRLAAVWTHNATMALRDPAAVVRQAALHAISVRRSASASVVEPFLADPDAAVRRAAAEAYGRLAKTAGPALVAALARESDPTAAHSQAYALIEIADAGATAPLLKHESANVRRAALFALNTMHSLTAPQLLPSLVDADARVQAAARYTAGRHPEWVNDLLPTLRTSRDAALLAQFASVPSAQPVFAERMGDAAVLQAIVDAKLKYPPAPWADAIADHLSDPLALAAAKGLSSPKLTAALQALARSDKQSADVRVQALALLPDLEADAVGFLSRQFEATVPLARRLAAADALGRARLSTDDLTRLAKDVAAAGPLELERLWPAFAKTTDEGVGLALVASLRVPALRASLRVESLKPRLDKFGPHVREAASGLYAMIETDTATQRQKLDGLLAIVKGGDIRRGQAIFYGTKAVCVTCHAVGYAGGKLGPDLTKIGGTRTERDLLEAIVFPSASFVRGYEPVTVTTHGGKSVTGILKRDADDAVIVATAADKEERIERKDVATVEPAAVSLMPAGLDQQLTPQELADLVAFLKACR
ncbi:MAG: c-type cytochrome [Gemmataceae bacterium]